MYEHDSAFHRLKVTDNDGVRLLKFEHNQQSSMRLDDPFETDIEYVAYFHVALALNPDIRRVLVIGLGGGTLVKRLWRDYPEMRIDAIELDPEVVDVAYELFELPRDERIRVFTGDGRAVLSASNETYDLIVVDAFDDDHVPPHLLTEEFLRECKSHLAENGVLAYNLITYVLGDKSKPFRSFYRTLGNVWRNAWLFAVGLYWGGPIQLAFGCNVVVFATDAETSAEQLLARIANGVEGRVSVKGFGLMGKDLYQGKIRTGDVPMLTDPRSAKVRRLKR